MDASTRGVVIVLLAITTSAVYAQRAGHEPRAAVECGEHPADVIFLLDSSSSIKANDFRRQVEFVKGVVEYFDVGPNKTQVGALSFSNWAFLEFHLKTYPGRWSVQAALSNIHQIQGDTSTADAIAFVRDVMLKPHNGARSGIPHIAIVLTDGKSNEPSRTTYEAARARSQGTHVFAIGIGSKVDRAELVSIASSPSDHYVFQVGDFTALQYIKEILAIKTCGVTDAPTTTTEQPTEPTPVNLACGTAALADIVFAPAPAASPENTEKALAFFREVSSGFDIDSGRVRVGVVPKECNSVPELTLEAFDDKGAVMEHIDALMDAIPMTAMQIKYMRRESFRHRNGARPSAKKIALLLVDGGDDLSRAKYEAHKLRAVRDVELFVIGVGTGMDVKLLHALASNPARQHVFHVDAYDELPRIIYRVRDSMCPGL